MPDLKLACLGADLTLKDPVSVTRSQSKPVTVQTFHEHKPV